MKYFIDTEFIEGKQDKTFLGIKYGETKPTIDLISIGIVSEDSYTTSCDVATNNPTLIHINKGKEYYAISKDFNLKAAWNNEWVRENVLRPIYVELDGKYYEEYSKSIQFGVVLPNIKCVFTINNLKKLLNKYGKTNKQIAQEIIEFTDASKGNNVNEIMELYYPEFYGYYSDYDWVVFCQLFGTMMDLPTGFPYYCLDLMQYLHDKAIKLGITDDELKKLPNYPKQENEHSSIFDAKWNYELYKFLNTL